MPPFMKRLFTTLLYATLAGSCLAQTPDPEPGKYYRLDFTLKEMDGAKTVNNRKYSIEMAMGKDKQRSGHIRSGDKIPVRVNGEANSASTYVEVGVNIDCQGREVQGQLELNVTADISTAAPGIFPPLIRNTKWSSEVSIPVRKTTMLFSSEDASSNHQLQLEILATPIAK